jgi:hypothetical protein
MAKILSRHYPFLLDNGVKKPQNVAVAAKKAIG